MKTDTRKKRKRQLIARDGLACHLCMLPIATEADATIDHITTRSRGGKHALDNLALAHKDCNEVRSDLPVEIARANIQDLLAHRALLKARRAEAKLLHTASAPVRVHRPATRKPTRKYRRPVVFHPTTQEERAAWEAASLRGKLRSFTTAGEDGGPREVWRDSDD